MMQSEISQNFKAVIKTTIFVCATVFSLSACEKQGSGSAAQPAAAAAQVAVAVPATQQELLASREPSANAAPLGLEIGFANLAGVKHKLGGMTNLESVGTNEYSEGPMLRSSGEGLGVDGLSQLLLIFDKDNVLVGVVMTLPKAPKDVLQKLSEKYQVVDNRIDAFMNNGYARLGKGESLIEIDAPHLSFTMEVRYLTQKLMADYQQKSAAANAKQRQEQVNKL